MKRINMLFLVTGVLLLGLILILSKGPLYNLGGYTEPSGTVLNQTFASKTDSQGEVTIEVEPTLIATSWDFEINLKTHSVELDQDL